MRSLPSSRMRLEASRPGRNPNARGWLGKAALGHNLLKGYGRRGRYDSSVGKIFLVLCRLHHVARTHPAPRHGRLRERGL